MALPSPGETLTRLKMRAPPLFLGLLGGQGWLFRCPELATPARLKDFQTFILEPAQQGGGKAFCCPLRKDSKPSLTKSLQVLRPKQAHTHSMGIRDATQLRREIAAGSPHQPDRWPTLGANSATTYGRCFHELELGSQTLNQLNVRDRERSKSQ